MMQYIVSACQAERNSVFLLLINFLYELHKQCTAATKDTTEASMNVMFRDIDCDYSTVTDLIYSTLCLKKTRLL